MRLNTDGYIKSQQPNTKVILHLCDLNVLIITPIVAPMYKYIGQWINPTICAITIILQIPFLTTYRLTLWHSLIGLLFWRLVRTSNLLSHAVNFWSRLHVYITDFVGSSRTILYVTWYETFMIIELNNQPTYVWNHSNWSNLSLDINAINNTIDNTLIGSTQSAILRRIPIVGKYLLPWLQVKIICIIKLAGI